jgi:hypothetical protein
VSVCGQLGVGRQSRSRGGADGGGRTRFREVGGGGERTKE